MDNSGEKWITEGGAPDNSEDTVQYKNKPFFLEIQCPILQTLKLLMAFLKCLYSSCSISDSDIKHKKWTLHIISSFRNI